MLWPSSREYRAFPQPATLASFEEVDIPGDLIIDETGSLYRAMLVSKLLVSDPLAWTYEGVRQAIYDGVEKVNGVPCWKITFLQTRPECAVNLFIDCRTFMERRVVVTKAVDDEGRFAPSFAKAAAGVIRIASYDVVTTEPSSVPASAFRVTIPAAWHERPTPLAVARRNSMVGQPEGFLESFVKATFSLGDDRDSSITAVTEYASGATIGADWLHATDSPATAVALVPGTAAGGNPIAFALESKRLGRLSAAGRAGPSFPVRPKPDLLAIVPETSGVLAAVADVESGEITGYSMDGTRRWGYSARQPVSDMITTPYPGCPGPARLRVASAQVVRTIAPDGRVLFSTRRTETDNLSALPAGAPGAFVGINADNEMVYFDQEGRVSSLVALGKPFAWFTADPLSSPTRMVAFGADAADSRMLRMMDAAGSPEWTAGLAQKRRLSGPVGVAFVGVGTRAAPRRFIVTVLADGRLFVHTLEGELAWRGTVKPAGREANRRGGRYVNGFAVGDADGDGRDEIYLATSSGVARLSVMPASR